MPATDLDEFVGDVLKMSNLSFQGVMFGSAVDASGMDSLHIDLWSAGEGAVQLFLISPGPVETPVTLEVSGGVWNSFEIDLSAYADVASTFLT